MQSLMGETTAVAHGGNPQDRTASPRPRCIALLRFRLRDAPTHRNKTTSSIFKYSGGG
ncbi:MULTISPECIES: hypothetical protein [unclassified Moorena]|uniref:hypothetical protein n=1 Tax=unclassified Moorena TaxID=2683338 RepID=UPI0013FE583A|nr:MULTISPECIES: hypothetical protein [unclassified Moorena]NEO16069.1 hypothetical protein [Moorena sp. SIO3E8]NEQ02590.1 hypothetical protein [Moorena sp. SIO3F7]